MKPFPSESGRRQQPEVPRGPAGFRIHDLTDDHIGVLMQLGSPWTRLALSGLKAQNAFPDALRNVTEEEMAEFIFVLSRPGCDSKALIAKGRAEFTRMAVAFVLRHVSAEVLRALAADGGALFVNATMQNFPSSWN